MRWPVALPGSSLEAGSNAGPRGMSASAGEVTTRRDRTRLTGRLWPFFSFFSRFWKACAAWWRFCGHLHRFRLARAEIQGNGSEVLGREEVRPEVRVAFGHDDAVVPEDDLQLLDRAARQDPLRREGVPRGFVPA